ncbi:hypothetical protein [Cellulomonas humilata]|uniref:HTH HARE-type domain-containing protein n=1 Tax=Cellulomonas humilata TaxID=144055 RepID=A0ABU0EL22_9CELL|nr:hypothetical protein [Cellulomonas humilata]MDQ0375973.1 hypothetical protein [Cellulomonas humilata]
MKPWKLEVVDALRALGGSASLAQIYAQVRVQRPGVAGSWEATVRNALECHSSDSANFKGEDLFALAAPKGHGIWRLR